MRFVTTVSTVTLIAFWTASGGALAQSAINIHGTELLGGFTTLNNTQAGRSILDQNIRTAVQINNQADAETRARALVDAVGTDVSFSEVLGSRMSGIYRAASNKENGLSLPQSIKDVLGFGTGVAGGDSGVLKYIFANGTIEGKTPVSAATLAVLPPGAQFDVLSKAYGLPAGASGSDKYGDPRPFQAARGSFGSIQGYDAVDFFGNKANSFSYLVGPGSDARNSPSFPSGHTVAGYAYSLLFASMVPERYQEALTRASEFGNNRIVLGAHYPLDVIAGRILAMHDLAHMLANDPEYTGTAPAGPDFQAQLAKAGADLRGVLSAGCGTSVQACAASAANLKGDRFADKAKDKADYTYRLAYGMPGTAATNGTPLAVTDPAAQTLLATRFPYLTSEQRTDVLFTTQAVGGVPFDNGPLGFWARLNLYAAADGYGAFNGPVTVTMDAAKGGFSAFDTFANDIGGSGSLTKSGTGTLALTGANTYSGGTTIDGGALIGSSASFGSGAIVDKARLILDQATTGTLANAISGNGAMTKTGLAALTLTGDSSFSGNTEVAQGRLAVNGSLAHSMVVVDAGASLGGTGRVGSIAALKGATVAPGNSIGTLNVAGDIAVAPGSTYQVEANAAGQSDRLVAGGAAVIGGGAVQVQASAGAYDPRTTYVILNAAGGVSGRFEGVTSNLAFLTPSLRYRPTEIGLTLTRNDIPFAAIATTRNAAAAATAIQAGGPGRLYDATVGLSTPDAQGAFRALAGDIHGSTVSATYETAFFVREAILDRLRWGMDLEAGSLDVRRPVAADKAGRPAQAPIVSGAPQRDLDPQVFSMWGQGFGAFGAANGGGDASSLDRRIAGFAMGADVHLPGGFKFGVVGGYTESALNTTGGSESATIRSPFGGLYGGYELGSASLRVGAAYADNDTRTRRGVAFGLSDNSTGHGGGSTAQGFGEIGYKFFFGQSGPAMVAGEGTRPVLSPGYIEPFVGGAYIGVSRERFAEAGGVSALTSFARSYDLGAATAGMRAQTSLDVGLGQPVSAHALLGYRRALGEVVPTALLAFDAGGPTFLASGVPIDRDAVVAEAGLDLHVALNATLGVAYTGQAGARAQDQAVKGNFTLRF